jgi:hypothetical protein
LVSDDESALMMSFFSSGVRSRSATERLAAAGAAPDAVADGVRSDVVVAVDEAAQAESASAAANAAVVLCRFVNMRFSRFIANVSILAAGLQIHERAGYFSLGSSALTVSITGGGVL